MASLLRYLLWVSLLMGTLPSAWAQFSITPQVNTALLVGSTQDYGTPRIGYGLEAGYRVAEHWGIVAAYDRYRFELEAGLEDINVNPTLIVLLNLLEPITLDLTAASWSGGIRYLAPFQKITPYAGVEASTNRITARGYGLSVSRRYWGIAPVIGVEYSVAPRWSLRADTRLQTIFIREDIPFVENIIDKNLIFVPIQMGVVFRLDL